MACDNSPSVIVVRVHGVRSDDGNVAAVLYGENPSDFLKKGKRLARERVPAKAGSVEVCLAAPHPGVYAVAVYHDENGNRKFDRSRFGFPREGYGFSNNAKSWLGPPRHKKAAFQVGNGPMILDIKLRY